jgi:hypothetical protein
MDEDRYAASFDDDEDEGQEGIDLGDADESALFPVSSPSARSALVS